MLRIDRQKKSMTRMPPRTLQESGLLERYDIQKMIRESSSAFFQEMGEDLLLLGEEVKPSDFVLDSIDLLALDKQGQPVVIELKRGNDKYQLLQALSYASMVAKWDPEQFVAERAKLSGKNLDEAEEEIEQFIDVGMDDFNVSQRVILFAEAFDFEALSLSEWLHKNYEMDARCFRLSLSGDASAEFLTCTCIYPPPELREHAVRRRGGGTSKRWANWEEALAGVENDAVAEFFRQRIQEGQEHNLHSRYLIFRQNGKRRWFMECHKRHAYIWQEGRFDGDKGFWTGLLGEGLNISPVRDERALRFTIDQPGQFSAFAKALKGDLKSIEFERGDAQA